jgi:hypothetical protein
VGELRRGSPTAFYSEPAFLASRIARNMPSTSAEVPQLVRVDHRADRLDHAVRDVEREDPDDAAVSIHERRTRLAVHLVPLDVQLVAREPRAQPAHEPADAVAADDRTRPRRAHPTRVAGEDHVVGEHVDQLVDVPVPADRNAGVESISVPCRTAR